MPVPKMTPKPSYSLADLGGGMLGTHPPPWDTILSFLHSFLLKSSCIGGLRPPLPPPQRIHAPAISESFQIKQTTNLLDMLIEKCTTFLVHYISFHLHYIASEQVRVSRNWVCV